MTTIEDALLTRHSCRAFLPTPVPRAEVERLLALAARSPSNSNSQPWQVHVLTGAAKRALTADLLRAYDAGGKDVAEFPYQPRADRWREPFRSRRRRFGESLYRDALGIAEDDTAGRRAQRRRNYRFFGAPVEIVLTVSRTPLEGALVDAGLFLQALMLAARGCGLDTCAQASLTDFHTVVRRHVTIPDDHVVVCGVALGYADERQRLSTQRTTREPVASFATFYDSDGQAAVDSLPRRSSRDDRMPGNLPTMTDLSTPITTARPRPLLRTALKLDAVVTGANGAAYLAAAGPLSDLLGLSETLLRATGAFLLAYAAIVWLVGARREIPRGPVYAIVVGNAIWAAGSLVAAIAGWGDPTTAGTVWIVMQAVVVAAFAELQLAGLRREGR